MGVEIFHRIALALVFAAGCIYPSMGEQSTFSILEYEHALRENTKSPKELSSLCKTDDEQSCIILAGLLLSGKGVKQDKSLAEKLLSETCDKSFQKACIVLAHIYSYPKYGFRKDFLTVQNLLENACGLSYAVACESLGFHYLGGFREGGSSVRDIDNAENSFQRACDLGLVGGCLILSEMYGTGVHREEDLDKSYAYYQSACNIFKKTDVKAFSSYCDTTCAPNKAYFGSWASSAFCGKE